MKTITQVSPLDQDQLKYLSRHIADVNPKPFLKKRSVIDAIRSFCKKPWVDLILYVVGTVTIFSIVGAIALYLGLCYAGDYN